MDYSLKIQVIKRLVSKGDIPSAEIACNDWGINTNIISLLQGGEE